MSRALDVPVFAGLVVLTSGRMHGMENPMENQTPPLPPARRERIRHPYKEEWLSEALKLIREYATEHGYAVPERIRVSTGWPSKQALSVGKRRIGEAWSPSCSDDDVHEIIISLYLDKPQDVLAVLVHEVVHTIAGVENGHRKAFSECAAKLGLQKPWTATTPREGLLPTLTTWQNLLGDYPHSRLDGSSRKKEKGRALKLTCKLCGCTVRTTAKWIDIYGEFPCPCGGKLKEPDQ